MKVIDKLNALRKLMEEKGIDAYFINDSDKHDSEYVNDFYKERSFMSNFNGSNGLLLVLKDKAYLWTDGRYFLEAEKVLNPNEITLMKMYTEGYPSIDEFIKTNLEGKTIGLNGETTSYFFVNELLKSCWVASSLDLVDEIWADRGELKTNPIWLLNDNLSGEKVGSKLKRIRDELKKNNVSSLILSNIDDIAWTFNLRGSDIAITPVFLSFACIKEDGAYIFLNKKELEDEARKSLEENGIIIKDYDEFLNFLKEIKGEVVQVSYRETNYAFICALKDNNEIKDLVSPVQAMKAIKNDIEIKNNIDIHKADGLAVFRFMKYIKENYNKVPFDEYNLSLTLESFRKLDNRFYEVSFESIVGWNSNGAIVHYEPKEDDYSEVKGSGLLLVDSGGQYMGGTTDITRTYALGDITDEMKELYTLVLKSHIAVAKSKFIKGTTGANIDMLSRAPFWEKGLDYNHGTGHGIGYMLNVHEGPQSIGYRQIRPVPIMPGMITSNEPGIYLEGKFGVRIESEVLCVKDRIVDGNEFYKFDTITYAPIDLEPVKKELLTKEEIKWLNDYHKNVYYELSKICKKEELDYLTLVTKEI